MKKYLLILIAVLTLGVLAATPPPRGLTTLGDLIYGGTGGKTTRLPGNTTSTKKFLVQTGNGSVSAAPSWDTIIAGDIPTLNQNTTGNAATATALASNPTDCGAGEFANAIAANGNLTCATPAGGSSLPDAPDLIDNCSIEASVASSALTIALKDADGSDPTANSACTIAFRNATLTTGTYAQVQATSATSVVVSNGSSLGGSASKAASFLVYAINNSGTIELGVINGEALDETNVHTSTAEGGSGGADTANVLYSTTARTSKAVRLIGVVNVTPAASFAYTNAPTLKSNLQSATPPRLNFVTISQSTWSTIGASFAVALPFTSSNVTLGDSSFVGTNVFTAKKTGWHVITLSCVSDLFDQIYACKAAYKIDGGTAVPFTAQAIGISGLRCSPIGAYPVYMRKDQTIGIFGAQVRNSDGTAQGGMINCEATFMELNVH